MLIPTQIYFDINFKSMSSQFLEDLAIRLRQLEMERVDNMEEIYNHQKMDLIIKQRQAKKLLFEIDDSPKRLKPLKCIFKNLRKDQVLQTSKLHGWEEYDDNLKKICREEKKKKIIRQFSYAKTKQSNKENLKMNSRRCKDRLKGLEKTPNLVLYNHSNESKQLTDIYKKCRNSTQITEMLRLNENWISSSKTICLNTPNYSDRFSVINNSLIPIRQTIQKLQEEERERKQEEIQQLKLNAQNQGNKYEQNILCLQVTPRNRSLKKKVTLAKLIH